jgi:hypothetical protein
MYPTTAQIIETARGNPVKLPAFTHEGEPIGPWVTCRCGSSHRTPKCPTCAPTIHRVPLASKR